MEGRKNVFELNVYIMFLNFVFANMKIYYMYVCNAAGQKVQYYIHFINYVDNNF